MRNLFFLVLVILLLSCSKENQCSTTCQTPSEAYGLQMITDENCECQCRSQSLDKIEIEGELYCLDKDLFQRSLISTDVFENCDYTGPSFMYYSFSGGEEFGVHWYDIRFYGISDVLKFGAIADESDPKIHRSNEQVHFFNICENDWVYGATIKVQEDDSYILRLDAFNTEEDLINEVEPLNSYEIVYQAQIK